jgi:nucleotide-binding universal stress UspA family protein
VYPEATVTLVVPFDGSSLSESALARAVKFDTVLEEGVVAVAVLGTGYFLVYGREFDAYA